MNRTAFTYPAAPAGADEKILQPSGSFKKAVLKVVLALLLFANVYVLMLVGAVALAAGFVAAGHRFGHLFPSMDNHIIGSGPCRYGGDGVDLPGQIYL